MRPAHRTAIRAAIIAAIWVVLLWRGAVPDWVNTPQGRVWGLADDVYVTADYARTFAAGRGLLWYPGAPRVEGFSSPLWALLLTPFHWLPETAEPKLGLYVLALQVALLASIAWLLSRMLEPIFERARAEPVRGRLTWVFTVLAPLAAGSLCCWAAEGFEVALVALFSVWSFKKALEPTERLRERHVGLLIGLAFIARMDAVLSCLPALLLVAWKLRRSRRLLAFGVSCAIPVALLFILRRFYYGDFLPNTYYLKISGWALSKRLGAGVFQNVLELWYYGLAGLPFLVLSYRLLAVEDRQVLFGFLAPVFTLLYSTHNGGDFEWIGLGFDRYVAPALPLLVFTFGAVLFAVRTRPSRVALLATLVTVLGFGPVLTQFVVSVVPADGFHRASGTTFDPHLGQLLNPFHHIEQNLFLIFTVLDARILERVTRPQARIAVCAAGATIYFSHRGGVDILGKNDAYIAHLPAADKPGPDSRCFRAFAPSGHNKEDMHGLFALRTPEVSLLKPPVPFIADYVSFIAGDRLFYGRRHSYYVYWNKVKHVQNAL